MKLSEAQTLLLDLIRELEAADTEPAEAIARFNQLKKDCPELKADYVLSDFQTIYQQALSTYDASSTYETSDCYVESSEDSF